MGKFVVIEGINGSGKTTISQLLVKKLIKNKYSALYTYEPTDGPIGKLIRSYLSNVKVRDHILEALLFAADRRWHVKNIIIPGLKKHDFVICDRYVYSSYAYQITNGITLNWLMTINKEVLEPDIVILLDIDPKVSINRLSKEYPFLSHIDLKIIRKNYLDLAKVFNFKIVNAERGINDILNEVFKIIIK